VDDEGSWSLEGGVSAPHMGKCTLAVFPFIPTRIIVTGKLFRQSGFNVSTAILLLHV